MEGSEKGGWKWCEIGKRLIRIVVEVNILSACTKD